MIVANYYFKQGWYNIFKRGIIILYSRNIFKIQWLLKSFSALFYNFKQWTCVSTVLQVVTLFISVFVYNVNNGHFLHIYFPTITYNDVFRNVLTNVYPFKVSNSNIRKKCEICSKLIIKTPERRHWHHLGLAMFSWNMERDSVFHENISSPKWYKVFKSGQSKFCGKQPLKKLKG